MGGAGHGARVRAPMRPSTASRAARPGGEDAPPDDRPAGGEDRTLGCAIGRVSRSRPPGPRSRCGRGAYAGRDVERVAVALVGPVRGLVAQRGVEADRVQHPLDVVGVVALLEQRERDAPGAAAGLGERRVVAAGLGPLRVRGLHVGGEAAEVTRADRRDDAPHRDRGRTSGPRTRGRTG